MFFNEVEQDSKNVFQGSNVLTRYFTYCAWLNLPYQNTILKSVLLCGIQAYHWLSFSPQCIFAFTGLIIFEYKEQKNKLDSLKDKFVFLYICLSFKFFLNGDTEAFDFNWPFFLVLTIFKSTIILFNLYKISRRLHLFLIWKFEIYNFISKFFAMLAILNYFLFYKHR